MVANRRHYRPDIDGLRALAIAGVLLFHVNEKWLPGGFVGVDVFFVISGYLITGILTRGIERGTFSLADFYERRIRRIFPALLVMFAVVLACGWLFMLPEDFGKLAKSMRYAVFSFSNVHFMKEMNDYFSPEDIEMPLLHTWSLSVEEQFYLVFPLLLMGLFRWVKGRRQLLVCLSALALLSLAGSEIALRQQAGGAFFLLPWRAWELLLGGILSLWGGRVVNRGWAEGIGFSGLAMILGSVVFFDGSMGFPGMLALVPCVGAAMLIFAGRQETSRIRAVMGWKPLVGLGLISYSVYLWHWPLVSFTAYMSGEGNPYGGAIVAGSLVLGWLSWRFVEKPFRQPRLPDLRMAVGSVVAAILAICVCERMIRSNSGYPERFSKQAITLANQERPTWRLPEAGMGNADQSAEKKVVAVWGDSHAVMLGPALEEVAEDLDVKILGFAKNAYPPLPDGWAGPVSAKDPAKREFAEEAFRQLKSDPSIDVVVLACRWWSRLGADLDEDQARFDDLSEIVRGLTDSGKRVVVVFPVPEMPLNVPQYAARRMKWGLPVAESYPESEESKRWNPEVVSELLELADIPGVTFFRPRKLLLKDGMIAAFSRSQPLYRDEDHLTPVGALRLTDGLRSALAEALAGVRS